MFNADKVNEQFNTLSDMLGTEKLPAGENVLFSIKDGVLAAFIQVDESKVETKASSTGKSTLVAVHSGKVPGTMGLRATISIYRPSPKQAKGK